MNLVWVFLGGGIGAACRWAVSKAFDEGVQFPFATLTVNLVGCFLIGLVYFLRHQNSESVVSNRRSWIS